MTAKPAKSEYHEWLTYEFTEREPAKATVALKWEELQVPLTIAVDDAPARWVAKMKDELRGYTGFNWRNWQQAADYCLKNKIAPSRGARLGAARRRPELRRRGPGSRPHDARARAGCERKGGGGGEDVGEGGQPAGRDGDRDPPGRPRSPRRGQGAAGALDLPDEREALPEPVARPRRASCAVTRASATRRKRSKRARLALAQAPDEPNKKGLTEAIAKLEKGDTKIN